jgi:hypothetical protein
MYEDPGDMIKDRIRVATIRSPIAVFEICDVVDNKRHNTRLKAVFGATIATKLLARDLADNIRMPRSTKASLQNTPRGTIKYKKFLGAYHKESLTSYSRMMKTGEIIRLII